MFGAVSGIRGSLLILLIFTAFSVNAESKPNGGTFEKQSDLDQRYESLFAEDHEIVAVRIGENHLHEVDEIARRHGYENLGQIGSLTGYYEFKHVHHGRLKRAALNRLNRDTRVLFYILFVNLLFYIAHLLHALPIYSCGYFKILFTGTMV